MCADDTERAWASGALMGVGFTYIIIGTVAFSYTLDPVGSLIVGALIFGSGWWLKRSVDTDTDTDTDQPGDQDD